MILLIAIAVGLVITILRSKLTGRPLKLIKIKFSWLVFAAVLPQILIFQIPAIGRHIPDGVVTGILVTSQILLLVFTAINILRSGFWLLGLGLFANFLVIILNGGWMPISPGTVHQIFPTITDASPLVGHRFGLSKDWIYADNEIRLPWLSDRFTLPAWSPYQVAFSLGDILIAMGAVWLLWSLSNPENKEIK